MGGGPVKAVEISGADIVQALESFRATCDGSDPQAQFTDAVLEHFSPRELHHTTDATGLYRIAEIVARNLQEGVATDGGISSNPLAGDREALKQIDIKAWEPELAKVGPKLENFFQYVRLK